MKTMLVVFPAQGATADVIAAAGVARTVTLKLEDELPHVPLETVTVPVKVPVTPVGNANEMVPPPNEALETLEKPAVSAEDPQIML